MDISTQIVCAGHMYRFLTPNNLRDHTSRAVRALAGWDFDTIAFRGFSGAIIGTSVAQQMDKQMILVRKPGDDSHSGHKVEGHKGVKKYIILDDFIDSGATKRAIIDAISHWAPDASFLGLLEVRDITEFHLNHYPSIGRPYPLS